MRLVIFEDTPEGQKLLKPTLASSDKSVKPKKWKQGRIQLIPGKWKESSGWGEWVSYKLDQPIDSPEDRLSYAYFCCGYLYYYDDITRNGCVDHEITFLWANKNPKVTIYLKPGPCNTTPKKEINSKTDAKQDTNLSRTGSSTGSKKYNFLEIPPAQQGIDPQPPPAPPPPPQYS